MIVVPADTRVFQNEKIFLLVILGGITLGTDAVLYNGAYSQAVEPSLTHDASDRSVLGEGLHHRTGSGRETYDGSDINDVERIAAGREPDIDRPLGSWRQHM
jgi:hypothetical protein